MSDRLGWVLALGLGLGCGAGVVLGQAGVPPQASAPSAPASGVPDAQQPQGGAEGQPYQLQTGTTLILVPATVDIKGKILYDLKAEQFSLTDDGAPRRFRLEQEADALGLSLVVVVQCSRSAMTEYGKIEQLPTMIDAVTGEAPHEVALVRYGSHPQLVQPFTKKSEKIGAAMLPTMLHSHRVRTQLLLQARLRKRLPRRRQRPMTERRVQMQVRCQNRQLRK